MPPSRTTILLALAHILSLATAIPALVAPRGDSPYTAYATKWPTCGNDKSMSQFSTTLMVTTQPDCDSVIDTICRAAQTQSPTNPRNLGHTNGTCEGHMILPSDLGQIAYAECVEWFQSITETCMLLNGPKNYAAPLKQYGLRNVQYLSGAGETPGLASGQLTTWKAGSDANPGYLMGPPGVFGEDFQAIDADDVLNGGS